MGNSKKKDCTRKFLWGAHVDVLVVIFFFVGTKSMGIGVLIRGAWGVARLRTPVFHIG